MNLNSLIRLNIFTFRYDEIKFKMPLFQRGLQVLVFPFTCSPFIYLNISNIADIW